MATFKEVEIYIRKNFNCREKEKGKDFISLVFGNDDRSQLVVCTGGRNEAMGEFLKIVSPIGKLSGKKLEKALEMALVCPLGGLVKLGDLIALSTTIILENVDENEIQHSIRGTAAIADEFEKGLLGSDEF